MTCIRTGDGWSDEKETALEIIKQKLVQAPMRTIVDFKSTLRVYVDASETGFSIALLQDSTKHPNTM